MTVFFDPFKVIYCLNRIHIAYELQKKSNFVKDGFPGVSSPLPWPLYNMFLFYDII